VQRQVRSVRVPQSPRPQRFRLTGTVTGHLLEVAGSTDGGHGRVSPGRALFLSRDVGDKVRSPGTGIEGRRHRPLLSEPCRVALGAPAVAVGSIPEWALYGGIMRT
jgi:hypothetical protein